jgi:nicotinamidase-related amidase
MSAKALILIDVQEKLVPAIEPKLLSEVLVNIKKAIEFAKILDIEIIVTEQYPRGLGATIEELKQVLPNDVKVLAKTSFSTFGSEPFKDLIKRDEVLELFLVGMESHVCVYQSAMDAMRQNYQVTVLEDCICGRKPLDHQRAMELMQKSGVRVSTFELEAMKIIGDSKHESFKELADLLKS